MKIFTNSITCKLDIFDIHRKSQFRDEYTLDQILASKAVHDPLTKLQCCPTSDGSAAAILVSEDFVKARGLENQVLCYRTRSNRLSSYYSQNRLLGQNKLFLCQRAYKNLTNLNKKNFPNMIVWLCLGFGVVLLKGS